MKYDRPVTPAELSPSLAALAHALSPAVRPEYVDVRPLANAAKDECFPLVDEQVREYGGERIVGWALWEFPALFVEGEFHAVWKEPSGVLTDITPKKMDTARILFLPDPLRSYDGIQVNNVRRPVTPSQHLLRYLRTFDRRFELLNRGDRRYQHGEIVLDGVEAQELALLEAEGLRLFLELRSALPDIGPYSPCPCGSGKKVKWCHRAIANAA